MHTARPFHNHINESVIVVTSGLNINRCVPLLMKSEASSVGSLIGIWVPSTAPIYTGGIHDKHEIG